MKNRVAFLTLVLLGAATGVECSGPSTNTAQPTVLSPTSTPAQPSPTPTLEEPPLPIIPAIPTPEPPENPPSTDSITLSTYFIRGETLTVIHRRVPRTKAVARAATNELLKGVNEYERSLGFSSSIPSGVDLLDISIRDQMAIVDLTRRFESGGETFSMGARLAQLAFTLTQFPTVNRVQLRLEGQTVEIFGGERLVIDHPMMRDDFDTYLPPILVESPALGDRVTSPLVVRGLANTFEGVVNTRLLAQDGTRLANGLGMGMMGAWKEFTATLWFSGFTGPGTLQCFVHSPKDGSITNLVEIPLHIDSLGPP